MCIFGEIISKKEISLKRGKVAYRSFEFRENGSLFSPFYYYTFNKITNHNKIKPNKFNEDGFYCWKSPLKSKKYFGEIKAKVKIYGTVVEHYSGFRAEKFKILEIYYPEFLENKINKSLFKGVKFYSFREIKIKNNKIIKNVKQKNKRK